MIGTRLGQYRIDALLGQGGMGAVYLATDEMLGRQVAIKVLRDDADGQGTATERFRSEAQILARLDHPHILRLYGFSQHEGVLYMVTEFVKGEALQKRLERGGLLEVPQVLEWAGQVLDALDYAHQLGVVHRDIKPANILIDERNRARLLDFGIARIVGTEGPTQTGHAVGTLTYMAPEQVLDEDIDGRADIYAFAVVICQMLAGRRPYRATTTAGLIREIVDGPAPDVASLLPPHTAIFVPVLLHALARQPADRTSTAGEMRRELQAAAATPVLTPPPLPPLVDVAIPTSTGQVVAPGPAAVSTGTVGAARRSDTGATTSGPVGPVTGSTPIPPPMAAALPTAANPPVSSAVRRRPGAVAYAIPAVLVLATAGLGWALFGPARLVTPRVVSAPADTGSVGVSAEGSGASTQGPAPAPVASTADATIPAPAPVPVPGTPRAPAPATVTARPSAGAAMKGSASPRAGTGPSSAPATAPAPVAPAPPPPEPAPEPASTTAPTAVAVPATIEFKDLILMDRVDDEDEEIDVSVRLDQKRVVVLDEDGIAKRSIGYESIARATYTARKPGRFSLRRGASHWLTLEVGTTPVVLRLNGKSYEQVLTTLAGHGVHVERQP